MRHFSFYLYTTNHTAYLLLYVDDIILTASSPAFLKYVISLLVREISMTDLGALSHFLGIAITCSPPGLHLSQRKYALDIIERAGMYDCHPVHTPIDSGAKLSIPNGDLLDNPTI